jgi:ribosomal protein L34
MNPPGFQKRLGHGLFDHWIEVLSDGKRVLAHSTDIVESVQRLSRHQVAALTKGDRLARNLSNESLGTAVFVGMSEASHPRLPVLVDYSPLAGRIRSKSAPGRRHRTNRHRSGTSGFRCRALTESGRETAAQKCCVPAINSHGRDRILHPMEE